MVTPGTQCVMMLWLGADKEEGILREGVCRGETGLQILCLDLHSDKPSAFRVYSDTGTKGDGRYNLPISFIVELNYLHTLPFYLYARSLRA